MKSPITTHVLDTMQGRPAAGVAATLERQEEGGTWQAIGTGTTDEDGRIGDLLPAGSVLATGVYRLTFAVGDYFQRLGVARFYPYIPIVFEIADPTPHYHVPLLLNPFGYSTYRGS